MDGKGSIKGTTRQKQTRVAWPALAEARPWGPALARRAETGDNNQNPEGNEIAGHDDDEDDGVEKEE
ncbi:hypothetical protein B2J93_4264 [Marssonina coronariae]|uniref:Uncharacterized protein n=1 Tax=Diplocarpon coronariae TaxID=2795749 RepID=A0A218YZN5_9HELO|nr:hypothetical protein B2J93_4264 [Marssonina coronariae]